MTMCQIISDAVTTHLAWAETFEAAITSGAVSESMRVAGYDDLCKFGKWLYSLDDSVKHQESYRKVKDLHYQFHVVSGQVVELMISEAFLEARQLIEGNYAMVSAQLLQALREWRDLEQGNC